MKKAMGCSSCNLIFNDGVLTGGLETAFCALLSLVCIFTFVTLFLCLLQVTVMLDVSFVLRRDFGARVLSGPG